MIQPEKFDLRAICFVKIIIGKLIILILHKYCCRAFYCLSFKLTSSNCAWKNRWKYFFSTEGERGGMDSLKREGGMDCLKIPKFFILLTSREKKTHFAIQTFFSCILLMLWYRIIGRPLGVSPLIISEISLSKVHRI